MIKMNKRNGYQISKALHTFMWASILSSVAQLLSTLVDAVVVSNLIGPDAKVEWSLEPFIPNQRGGKIPVYVKL